MFDQSSPHCGWVNTDLFGAKPLSQLMLTYYLLDTGEQASVKLGAKCKSVSLIKMHFKMSRLQKNRPFCPGLSESINTVFLEHIAVVTTTVCLSGEEHSLACLAFMALYHAVFNVGRRNPNRFGSRGVIRSRNKHGASTRNGLLEQIWNGIYIHIQVNMVIIKVPMLFQSGIGFAPKSWS